MKQNKTNLNGKNSFWLKTTPIVFLSLLSLSSCEEKVTEVNEVKIKNESFSFQLPGKKGMITHHRTSPILPFENSYLTLPEDYTDSSFTLNHDYPRMGTVSTPATFPWKAVTGNSVITKANSLAYVDSLKQYITPDMKSLLFNESNVNSVEKKWYESIWLSAVREPIHGMYIGSSFPAKTLGETQDESLTTYVYTMYDKTAAQTLNNIWGTDSLNAYNPNLTDAEKTQYPEGSVIVKFAFINYNNTTNDWATLENAATWNVYTDVIAGNQSPLKNAVPNEQTLKLMQCDIIVKDSEAAPETGWVFSTLVYDKNAVGNDGWDRMIPLGATWGNDPTLAAEISNEKALADAVVPAPIDTTLVENWINPAAPSYAIQTLGWGGRLSGPNDGAVFNTGPITTSVSGHKFKNGGVSTVGCLGCHSTAQYQSQSFLLPVLFTSPAGGNPLVLDPGTEIWNNWFRNNDGKTPFDTGKGQIGLDYDMVTSFKAIPAWQAAMSNLKK